jgi:protein SCO1/2
MIPVKSSLPKRLVFFYVLSALLVVAVAGATYLRLNYARPALPELKRLPDFALTERSGKSVRLQDLRGKVLLVDFIYSECPGPCPMISSRFSALQPMVLQNPDTLLVSVTLNPSRDTPEVLRQYADRFHASPDRWLFLTGDKSKVNDLVTNGFMLTVLDSNDPKQPIIHSTKIALVDKRGVVRAYFDADDENNRSEILDALHQLVRE